MILHIFNPEHDIALAANLSNFTAPHAGRKLRADLGFLPALWAGEDDCVLVENVEQARRAYSRLRARVGGMPKRFVDKSVLPHLTIDRVEPWGWDLALRAALVRYGVSPEACADEAVIAAVRECSHRRYAAEVLHRLISFLDPQSSYLYNPVEATSIDEVESCVARCRRLVVKAPWSSSGRGVRFVDGELSDFHRGWLRNVIALQGSVMVEPYYPKVKDFGMEFEALPDGRMQYLGLSLFETHNGTYTGNIIATEEDKREMISRYVSVGSLDDVRAMVTDALSCVIGRRYTGPLGVDMMILSKPGAEGFLIHPCVEINLRRTMGHVAIEMASTALSASDTSTRFALPRVMQIMLTDKYRIRIKRL